MGLGGDASAVAIEWRDEINTRRRTRERRRKRGKRAKVYDARVEILRDAGSHVRSAMYSHLEWKGRQQFRYDVGKANSVEELVECAEALERATYDRWEPGCTVSCPCCCMKRSIPAGLHQRATFRLLSQYMQEYALHEEITGNSCEIACAIWNSFLCKPLGQEPASKAMSRSDFQAGLKYVLGLDLCWSVRLDIVNAIERKGGSGNQVCFDLFLDHVFRSTQDEFSQELEELASSLTRFLDLADLCASRAFGYFSDGLQAVSVFGFAKKLQRMGISLSPNFLERLLSTYTGDEARQEFLASHLTRLLSDLYLMILRRYENEWKMLSCRLSDPANQAKARRIAAKTARAEKFLRSAYDFLRNH